jgi:hypothetical protein
MAGNDGANVFCGTLLQTTFLSNNCFALFERKTLKSTAQGC